MKSYFFFLDGGVGGGEVEFANGWRDGSQNQRLTKKKDWEMKTVVGERNFYNESFSNWVN